MDTKSLYYPYINIPSSAWLTQQLLYLDQMGAIVPYEFIRNPEKLTPFMRDLVSSQLVKQIIPFEYMEYGYESPFENSFMELITSDPQISKIIDNKSIPRKYTRIHIEKFGYGWNEKLKDLGLLKKDVDPWRLVETRTAQLLMSYVAAVICSDKGLGMSPITNKIEYLKPYHDNIITRNKETVEQIILDKLLPAPSREITVSELVEFKQDNSVSLTSFRNMIMTKVEELRFVRNREEREFKISAFIKESSEQIDEISSRINEKSWGLNFVSICSLATSIIPVFEATEINNPEDLAKAAPGLMGALVSEYKSRTNANRSIRQNKYVYAAYVKGLE